MLSQWKELQREGEVEFLCPCAVPVPCQLPPLPSFLRSSASGYLWSHLDTVLVKTYQSCLQMHLISWRIYTLHSALSLLAPPRAFSFPTEPCAPTSGYGPTGGPACVPFLKVM